MLTRMTKKLEEGSEKVQLFFIIFTIMSVYTLLIERLLMVAERQRMEDERRKLQEVDELRQRIVGS